MRTILVKIILFFLAFIILPKINAQPIAPITLISTNIIYLRTEVTKSNNRYNPGSKYVQPAVTHYKNDYYSLKFSIKINEEVETPLDIKLISAKGKEHIYRVVDNIEILEKNKIYEYYLEIILNDIGWYKIEIGDFSKNANSVFDKTSIYVRK